MSTASGKHDFAITYVGGPTAVLSIDGVSFITDPTFDPPGGDYASGAVSLHKTRGPALAPGQLGPIDVALVSHDQHPDNLDTSGRSLLREVRHVLTTASGAARLGHGAIGLRPWQTWSIETPRGSRLEVTATPARHGPAGIEPISGEVTGFVIRAGDGGPDFAYVTGDTVWFDGTREVARRYRPRVVVLFGGAAQVRGPFHLTMSTNDAVETATAFEDAVIVPVHHDGWAHFTQSQDDLAKTFQALGIAGRLRRVTGGELMRFD
ncbi:MAG TPA: MBL fold metallo-hydrolase [Steroidobacteraceae bacterium]|nr:MBL fold metallo-hydrolase [Steroidobacteraceae bacterium]